jgi:arylsulfatase A-like enzyme
MTDPSPSLRHRARQAAALGALAGALEGAAIAHGGRMHLSFGAALSLVLVCVLLATLMALAGFLPAALLARLGSAPDPPSRRHALTLGLVAFGLAAWYFVPVGLGMIRLDRWFGGIAAFFVPIGFLGTVHFNARHWLHKAEVGWEPKVGFLPLAGGLALLLALGDAAWLSQGPRAVRGPAQPDDPSVLLVTIDTLRRDHVSAYGEPQAVPTRAFDALAAEGVLFTDAITPLPETAPSHAAMFTALHPLRAGVLANGTPLQARFTTLAERLRDEGYDTAAFVSSYAVDSSAGLDQGFGVYDDDFLPGLHGLAEIRAVGLLQRLVMRFGDPLKLPWLLERPGLQTNARALAWLAKDRHRPFFCWVHYFEPHAPYEPHGEPLPDGGAPPDLDHRWILAHEKGFDYTPEVVEGLGRLYDGEVAWADARLGELLAGLDATGHRADTLVIVTADHGELLGEHGYHFNHHSLYDEALRVPLVIRAPGLQVQTRVVGAQVRVLDLGATVLDYLGLDPMKPGEGVELLGYAEGERSQSLLTTLYGRTSGALDRGTLLGVRSGRTEGEEGRPFKYLRDLDAGREQLFDLEADPGEVHDIAAEQPGLVAQAHDLVGQEAQQAISRTTEVDPATRNALKALGYLE